MARKQDGFSLIELLISLVIIGVLATIAIPMFLGYRVRASQAEAKANLSALKVAMSAHYAEANGYTDDMTLLAWRPEGSPRYLYGFTSDAEPAASGANDTLELLSALPTAGYTTTNTVLVPGIPLTEADLPAGLDVTRQSYKVGAIANLDADNTLDLVTSDQFGNLASVTNDAAF